VHFCRKLVAFKAGRAGSVFFAENAANPNQPARSIEKPFSWWAWGGFFYFGNKSKIYLGCD
jgi:hypothetical protein